MVVKEDLFEMALNVYVLMERRCESTGKLLEGKAQGFKKHITTLQKKQKTKTFVLLSIFLLFLSTNNTTSKLS